MNSDFIFRELHADDLGFVADIEADVHIDPWSRAQILAVADLLAENYIGRVAVDVRGAVVGYLIAQKIVNEVEILTIGVMRTLQGQGIGMALLNSLLSFSFKDLNVSEVLGEALTACFLEVRLSNVAARMLYNKYGFIEVGRRKNYYFDPVTREREDALILRRSL